MTQTVGFIGLGALGAPVATNLLDSGYALRVHNRTRSKADPLIARGAVWTDSPAAAAAGADVVITLLWDDASVEAVVNDAGFLEALGDGVHVSMSTISSESTRRVAVLHANAGSDLVSAPIFGIPAAAQERALWVPVAGPADARARVRPVLEALGAKGVFEFGDDPGAAVTVKIAGNFLIVSAAESLAQALSMARAEGVDAREIVDMLTSTLFPTPVYENNGRALAGGRNLMRESKIAMKDIGLFTDVANRVGSETEIAEALKSLPRS